MDIITNISFIIIARNEQFGLNKCLSSLVSLNLNDCQVICIDSGSRDNTLQVMLSYKTSIENYEILTIDGYSNSAIARNAGIKIAEKDFIFFIDGDVEIDKSFLMQGIHYLKNGKADCVTGKLKEYRYTNTSFSKIEGIIDDRFGFNKEEKIYVSGGCFFVKREIVKDIGIFNQCLERGVRR